MSMKPTRRGLLKGSLAAAAGLPLAMSLEEQALLAQATEAASGEASAAPDRGRVKPDSKGTLPKGKLGHLDISRVFLGGNLIGGWAHARDLIYVSALLKAYHTPEKVFDTLQVAEEHGFNCINTHPNAGPLIQQYRKERGGKIVWLVQGFVGDDGDLAGIQASIDQGADAVYIQGGVGDRLVENDRLDLLGKAVQFMKKSGRLAGIGCHKLDGVLACEAAGLGVDYYVKTLHTLDYWSAKGPDGSEKDNSWCEDPQATIRTMADIKKPWIAFKVMAAGAIPPEKAFRYAFESGADFVMAGMFDFQVAQDAQAARKALANLKRERPWQA